jgi:hypothetical protein
MAAPIWQTTSGFLGTLTERQTVSIPVVATGADSYAIISGSLPVGLYINRTTGIILGTPVSIPTNITTTFVIRATNVSGVSDRTFAFNVTGPSNPVWVTPGGGLAVGSNGEHYTINREYVDFTLRAETDILDIGNTLKYFIADNDGNLPPGLSLSTAGRISGYVNDTLQINDTATIQGGYDTELYDRNPYEHGVTTVSLVDQNSYVKQFSIAFIAKESPCRVITNGGVDLRTGDQVYIQDVTGMTVLNGNRYYAKLLTTTSFELYTDPALTEPEDATSYNTYTGGGTVSWGTTENLRPQVINRIYQFYITVTDGIASNRRLFNIEVVDPDSLRVDTSYISVDEDMVNASAGYLLAPIWQSKYGDKLPQVYNLGSVRAGKKQILSVYEYDPYPMDGPVIFDWLTVGVNPDIRLYSDSRISAANLPTQNRQGSTSLYYKNAELTPVKGMKIQFNEHIPNTDDTIYTVTGVIKLSETRGIINIDQPLAQEIPDSKIFYVGTTSEHPDGLILDPTNGTLSGALGYLSGYAANYRFTIKVVKIDQESGDKTLYDSIGTTDYVWDGTKWNATSTLPRNFPRENLPTNPVIGQKVSVPNTTRIVGKVYSVTNNIYPDDVPTLNNPNYAENGGLVGDVLLVSMTPVVTDEYLLPLMDGTVRAYVFNGLSWDYLGNTVASNQIYLLNVLGNIPSTIEWVSTSSLGLLTPGEISELAVIARNTNTNYAVNYEIIQGELPPGLTFNQDGTIQGKVINSGQTYFDFASTTSGGVLTFDKGLTSIDKNWYVTIRASDAYRLSAVEKEFYVSVYQDTLTEFTRIYVRPFLSTAQRTSYKEFMTDPIIFDPAVMYRMNDPEFGVQTQIKMLLETGIEQASLNDYAGAMQEYFYRKSFYFGEVKSISAQDSAGNNVYDIVYVDIIDNQMNGRTSPSYSNSVVNMQNALEAISLDSATVEVNERLRPKYMTTLQSDTGVAIGFIKALVLCYTIPGGSTKVLSRIANAMSTGAFDFKQYHFDTDRIVVETVTDTEQTGWLLNPTERR